MRPQEASRVSAQLPGLLLLAMKGTCPGRASSKKIKRKVDVSQFEVLIHAREVCGFNRAFPAKLQMWERKINACCCMPLSFVWFVMQNYYSICRLIHNTNIVLLFFHSTVNPSFHLSFPHGSDCKENACDAGNLGLIPELGRSPGEGNGYPLQYSCLENPMDRGAWQATICGVTKFSLALWNKAKYPSFPCN